MRPDRQQPALAQKARENRQAPHHKSAKKLIVWAWIVSLVLTASAIGGEGFLINARPFPEDITQALEFLGYFILACMLSSGGGTLVIGFIMRQLWQLYTPPDAPEDHRILAGAIGVIERILYISSFLLGRSEFIAVWLILKAAGEWGASRRQTKRSHAGDEDLPQSPDIASQESIWIGISPEYTVFLIGNALSIALAVIIGLALQHLLPPFPSLRHWKLPITP